MLDVLEGACSAATLGTYGLARLLHRRFPSRWTLPILVTPVVLLAGLWLAHVPPLLYVGLTSWLVWFLGPATVAFAVPIYQNRELLRLYPLSISAGVASGATLGVASSWLVAHLLGLPPDLEKSFLLRSISTPFALEAARTTGASSGLTALVVILTGLFGLLLGEFLLLAIKPRSALAHGASWGASAHAFGTLRAHQIDRQVGAISSLIMILTGIVLVLLAPVLPL